MEIDVKYSLELLKKINSLTIEGEPINEHFVRNGYSLWSFQQYFLLSQIKEFSQQQNDAAEVQSDKESLALLTKINIWLLNIFILSISFLGLMKLYFCRPKILIFSSDILKLGTRYNPRLFATFEALEKERVKYIEIIHTVGGKKIISNFFKLRRLIFYSESINILFTLFMKKSETLQRAAIIERIRLETFNESEKIFVRALLARALENISISAFKISVLTRILKWSKVSTFIAIDDVRQINEILAACREAKIKSFVYQHSNFDYLIGLDALPPGKYIFPDAFYVWNEYWYNKIPELSPLYAHYKERVKVGGRTYSFNPGDCIPKPGGTTTESVSVLVPYEVNLNAAHVRPYMAALLDDPRIKVFFSLRNDFEQESQIRKYFLPEDLKNPQLTIFESKNKSKILESIDVVLGVYSGFLDEAIELCKPVGVLSTQYPTIHKLEGAGLASLLDLQKADVYAQICAIRDTPPDTLAERRGVYMRGAGDAHTSLLEILGR